MLNTQNRQIKNKYIILVLSLLVDRYNKNKKINVKSKEKLILQLISFFNKRILYQYYYSFKKVLERNKNILNDYQKVLDDTNSQNTKERHIDKIININNGSKNTIIDNVEVTSLFDVNPNFIGKNIKIPKTSIENNTEIQFNPFLQNTQNIENKVDIIITPKIIKENTDEIDETIKEIDDILDYKDTLDLDITNDTIIKKDDRVLENQSIEIGNVTIPEIIVDENILTNIEAKTTVDNKHIDIFTDLKLQANFDKLDPFEITYTEIQPQIENHKNQIVQNVTAIGIEDEIKVSKVQINDEFTNNILPLATDYAIPKITERQITRNEQYAIPNTVTQATDVNTHDLVLETYDTKLSEEYGKLYENSILDKVVKKTPEIINLKLPDTIIKNNRILEKVDPNIENKKKQNIIRNNSINTKKNVVKSSKSNTKRKSIDIGTRMLWLTFVSSCLFFLATLIFYIYVKRS